MAEAKKKTGPAHASNAGNGLHWYQGLQFKLASLLLMVLLLLAAGAFWASDALVQQNLQDDRDRREQSEALRRLAELGALTGGVEALAVSLAQLAASPGQNLDSLRAAALRMLQAHPQAALIADLGIWPEPGSLSASGARSSLFWLREGNRFVGRDDYNDERTAPYWRERWYTPARLTPEGRPVWTGRRQEPLSQREVLTVLAPITDGRSFRGVVSISIGVQELAAALLQLSSEGSGYSLLLDDGSRLLAATGSALALLDEPASANLASLARRRPAFAELALSLHRDDEKLRSEISKAGLYEATQVSALREASRELSRQEAEDILNGIWRRQLAESGRPRQTLRLELPDDPLLGAAAQLRVLDLPSPHWRLILVNPADEGPAGAGQMFELSLTLSLVLVALALLLVLLVVRMLVVLPLQGMTRQLANSETVEQALNLVFDEAARDEVGVLAHWQNERIRQLREAIDNARSARLQLSTETHERKQMQDQLARVQERTALALQSVSDAIITTDERGLVDDMNPVAELLTGVPLREARGKPLPQVLRLSPGQDPSTGGNMAEEVLQRGIRLDFPEGLSLAPPGTAPRDIALRAAPIRARGQLVGAVLTFHERVPRQPLIADRTTGEESLDPLTGLAGRNACRQRLQSLIDQTRVEGQGHALLVLDLDHLKRINDLGGPAAGDEVLVRVAELLSAQAPVARDVYRLAADQFAVVAEAADEASALVLGERLRAALARSPFQWESRALTVSASLGICSFDRSAAPLEVIRRADEACRAAKRAGRNRVLAYRRELDQAETGGNDDSWVRCIQRGLEQDLFHLSTQWIAAGSDYAAEGRAFEMLVALEDDEGFWAAPGAFLPAAERHHLTPQIDRWVIRHTLKLLQERSELVESLAFVSINLSALTLADHGFLEFLARQFEDQPALARKLCFELREDGLSEHPQEALLTCEVLHRMGCRISIDHYYGRRISELELLRRMPADFVKIDSQAFKNLASDPVEQILAESTLRMVRQLRRRVIVCNLDEVKLTDLWRKLGADYFQGYAFAKPSPVVFQAPD